VVVRDRDQPASTSLISIPALSEPCRAKLGFWKYSFFEGNKVRVKAIAVGRAILIYLILEMS